MLQGALRHIELDKYFALKSLFLMMVFVCNNYKVFIEFLVLLESTVSGIFCTKVWFGILKYAFKRWALSETELLSAVLN